MRSWRRAQCLTADTAQNQMIQMDHTEHYHITVVQRFTLTTVEESESINQYVISHPSAAERD